MEHKDQDRVHVQPMPDWARTTRYKPQHPPIFPGGIEPTEDDIELAVALIDALDPESQRWYAASRARLRMREAGGAVLLRVASNRGPA